MRVSPSQSSLSRVFWLDYRPDRGRHVTVYFHLGILVGPLCGFVLGWETRKRYADKVTHAKPFGVGRFRREH